MSLEYHYHLVVKLLKEELRKPSGKRFRAARLADEAAFISRLMMERDGKEKSSQERADALSSATEEKEEISVMGETLENKNKPTIAVTDVKHYGEKLILPENMTMDEAIELLKRRKVYLSETVAHAASYKVFPFDGAWVFAKVLAMRYGWAPGVPIRSFFGDRPPLVMQVDSGVRETVDVPWGKFEVPGTTITINTDGDFEGDVEFRLHGTCKRDDEEVLKALFADLREQLRHHSLYRAKAVNIQFNDDAGDALERPKITFIDTEIDESKVLWSRDVYDMIDTALFTPIRRVKDLEANGIQFKSGVLLGGPFGTGKTLAAKVASKLAVANGVTFIYIRRADEITKAISFARLYEESAAVVFCEDIDRVTDGERDDVVDSILNSIDGIDSKRTRVMVVATTNALEKITPAMLRPGRMDAVINVTPPDQETVVKIIRAYGGDAIEADADLTGAGEALQGMIPAIIAEVISRAKKVQLKLLPPGTKVQKISGEAIVEAAKTIKQQADLLIPKDKPVEPSVDAAVRKIIDEALEDSGY